MHSLNPRFPPLITGYAISATEDAHTVACKRAAKRELGAADVVWSRDTNRVDLALILEPDDPLARARQAYPLAVAALADSLGALMPPMTTLLLRWPATVLINGAEAGQVRFSASSSAEDAVPDWIVIGITLNLKHPDRTREGGNEPHTTTIHDEGGDDLDSVTILESISAHMLNWIHTWQEEGFRAVHEQFIGRLEGHEHPADIRTDNSCILPGRVMALSDDMQLLVKSERDGTMHALCLARALESDKNG